MKKILQRTLMTLAVAAAPVAFAADPAADSAKAQYDAERARCMSGANGQDQASCLRSAGAAYDAIKQNRLHDANKDYDGNAVSRCAALPTADRADCEARVAGKGTKRGSVQGGGDIKGTVTTIPAAPASK